MKYFGILKEVDLSKLDESERIKLLLDYGLFEIKLKASFDESSINDGVITIKESELKRIALPSEEVINEMYSYIMNNIFKNDILDKKLDFLHSFESSIYGIEYLDAKKEALFQFNKIYEHISNGNIKKFKDFVSSNNQILLKSQGRIETLYELQISNKTRLYEKLSFKKYFDGDTIFFEKQNLIDKFKIDEEVKTEMLIQILVELNNRFGFEEDYFFTMHRKAFEYFSKNQGLFKTFNACLFTFNQINEMKENHKAQVESLYEFLVSKNDLIIDNRTNFMKFLKDKFNIEISKIKSFQKNSNYTHDDRVEKYEEKWDKFLQMKNK